MRGMQFFLGMEQSERASFPTEVVSEVQRRSRTEDLLGKPEAWVSETPRCLAQGAQSMHSRALQRAEWGLGGVAGMPGQDIGGSL